MRTVTFLTGHYYNSKRRAGFHNLADAAHRQGCKVHFVTIGYSLLSFIRGDYRTRIPGIRDNYNVSHKLKENLFSYVHFTRWHPMTLILPPLNKLSMRWMDSYGSGNLGNLLPIVRETDLFVYESGPALFLFDRFSKENPYAKKVYRVSDDIRILGSTHPRLIEVEKGIADAFDCVSVPSVPMLGIFPGLGALRLDRHGLDKEAYDSCGESPYAPGTVNAIFAGTGYMEENFFRFAAQGHPDCTFNIIGPMENTLKLPNVRYLGEMPFKETLPYIKYADVGLATRTSRKGYASTLTDSLKILQYRYCGLPIISPDFIDLKRDAVAYYTPNDAASCARAISEALAFGKDPVRGNEVRSWDEVWRDITSGI